MTAHRIMQRQAGGRMILTMSNGRARLTSHYGSIQEFYNRLDQKNASAPGTWHAVCPDCGAKIDEEYSCCSNPTCDYMQ